MTPDQATVGAFIVAALALAAAFLRWVWPPITRFFRALSLTFETINGRPAQVDNAGREVEPAEPSLRVQLADLKATVSDQAEQNGRITAVEMTLAQHTRITAEHAERLGRLEDRAQLERLLARHESTSAFNAIEAVARQEPETK